MIFESGAAVDGEHEVVEVFLQELGGEESATASDGEGIVGKGHLKDEALAVGAVERGELRDLVRDGEEGVRGCEVAGVDEIGLDGCSLLIANAEKRLHEVDLVVNNAKEQGIVLELGEGFLCEVEAIGLVGVLESGKIAAVVSNLGVEQVVPVVLVAEVDDGHEVVRIGHFLGLDVPGDEVDVHGSKAIDKSGAVGLVTPVVCVDTELH